MWGKRVASLVVVGTLAYIGAASPATAAEPAAIVDAEGNVFVPGSLKFDPAHVSVAAGDFVRWRNTDVLVPHTATEDHGLWNLSGSYGATPFNPPGFAPGQTRQRRFAAGAWSYFCEVHPVEMRGTVSVPVSLSDRKTKRKGKNRFEVIAEWALRRLPPGQVFEVQRRRGARAWKTVREGTTFLGGVFFAGRKGKAWSFRARVRAAEEPDRASGYSPVATIAVG